MKLYEKAKLSNLVELAEKSGFRLRKQGMGYAANHCPHCSPGRRNALSIYPKDGIWRWNCFRCARGGTAIDFAAAVWGVSEKEAAMRLANDSEFNEVKEKEKRMVVSSENTKKVLEMLLQHGHTSVRECLDYLSGRGISEKTAMEAVRRGILRFLPYDPFRSSRFLNEKIGIENLREAGFLKPGSRWAGIAFRPLVFFFPGCNAAEFRIARNPKDCEPKAIRYGQVKWPWWWKEGETVTTIYIVEGIIDLLSMVELGLKEGEAIIAIPGVSSWKTEWFTMAIKSHPKARFVIALDADEPGKRAAHGLREFLESIGARVSVKGVAQGKDWNEFLVLSRAA